jgi:predicted aldo/keto reductase-like oxidoreductase
MATPQDGVSRRDFLWQTGASAAALGLGAWGSQAAWGEAAQSRPAVPEPTIPHGTLGRTGYAATYVSMGAILLKGDVGTRVLQLAIDRGVNLMHTSASYGGGGSVAACGELFKAAPDYRNRVFLCLKSYHPEKESEVDEMLTAMHTDHADALLTELQSPDPQRVEAIMKQQDNLKKKGKIRHTGFVCHGDMNEVTELVAEKHAKYFDVALLAMKLVPNAADAKKAAADQAGQRFLKNVKALRKAGVGILAMKTGAQRAVEKGADVFLPLLKLQLEAGSDAVLTSMNTLKAVEMATSLKFKSPRLDEKERQSAADFQDSLASTCRMCAECTKVCPQGLAVNDLMRFRMYHEDYGWREHARAEYAASGVDYVAAAAGCGDCSACAEVCPVKLASASTVRHAAELLA